MSDTTPDLSRGMYVLRLELLYMLPSNATGNVGDAAASNSVLTSDDVVEVSDRST